jgi:hypothetical protein
MCPTSSSPPARSDEADTVWSVSVVSKSVSIVSRPEMSSGMLPRLKLLPRPRPESAESSLESIL